MTCRRYCLSYFPEWPSLDAKSTETLLIMLEKDVPNLLYCSKCAIVHTWRLYRYSNVDYMSGVYLSRSCRHASAFHTPNFRESIQYQSARLAMNYHLYGPTHGFPLNMLEKDGERRDDKTNMVVKSTQQARIVDDELILRISRKVHNPNGSMKRLESFLRDDNDQKICRHHTIWNAPQRSSTDPAASASPAPVVDDGSPAPLSLPPFLANFPLGVVFSCPACLVDVQVKASWYGTTERWSVTIDTWTQLGACRSVDDPKWKSSQSGGAFPSS
ncbi:hypothetical protein CSOJ01_06412 [Colletotrichum sojae]|uniref:Uncharacterized protein n=1 Tax=Colletotrichum sojae TaxID=2175907 RepID=A0A8H6JCV8_9PEZI|nr:hypothetical protein CSOJ01_06412 [Colletotrichum sojae]